MDGTNRLNVVEIASGTGASYATRYLHALGALVTKVQLEDSPLALPELDLNKALIRLNPANAKDREVFLDAIANADVVVQSCSAAQVDEGLASLGGLRAAHPAL